MAKISHPNFVDTINDVLYEAKKRQVLMLESNDQTWRGNQININSRDLANFGTCGYLGLEIHPKIIEKSIEFTQKFGAQFSVSRTYLTSEKNKYLESLLSEIFNYKPVIVYTSTTLAHIGALPIVVGHNDVIILDQQSHISIQNAAQLMAQKGVPVEIVRHSNMEMLEYKLKSCNDKCEKIWYMIDGVYSMYGDIAPIEEINELMQKYPKLHLYVDDAHGMSWHGKNGCGRIFESCELNKKTIYVSTLAKGFGTMGGVVVFPDETWYKKVIIHGGPLAYSHPIPPPMMGASIASAEIHLSSEIILLQNSLKEKLNYTKELIEGSNLPLVSNPETPIFFVGTGQPTVGYNLNSKILNDGFYVTIGIFPGVPIKNTGLRFTINNHLSKSQIKDFIDSLKKNYPLALKEENKTLNDVLKAFKMPLVNEFEKDEVKSSIQIYEFKSIQEIDKAIWNKYFYDKGNFDWDALILIESAFKNNPLKENNWDFYYLMILDGNDEIILMSFFSNGIFKDDMLSPVNVSNQIEKIRITDSYYLCSNTFTMGCLFSEGEHLYFNRNHKQSSQALKSMIDWSLKKQETLNANALVLRDFNTDDTLMSSALHEEGFFKMNMPNSNATDIGKFKTIDDLISTLSAKNRRHYKEEVHRFSSNFHVKFKQQLEHIEIDEMYNLFLNVTQNNQAFNIFPYPKKLIEDISINPNWETMCLYIKIDNELKLAGVCFCHFSEKSYDPIFLGINYEIGREFKVYKQLLYQLTSRAINLKKKILRLGLSADTDKKKIGAKQNKICAYVSVKDNFNLEVINNIFTK
jgi:7-keto-8-aminopelargonate synthetase-like enzyme